MATVNSWISAVRFGYGVGLNQSQDFSLDKANLLGSLSEADTAQIQFPVYRSSVAGRLIKEMAVLSKQVRNGNEAKKSNRNMLRKEMRDLVVHAQKQNFARATFSEIGFRERLVQFWFDHFTVSAHRLQLGLLIGPYIDEAIRPNITGSFAQLLSDAILHPAMLVYLDQVVSVGPNSVRGKKSDDGLNENLARELLELHTMGVNGRYTQNDVRQLAELLTGIRVNHSGRFFDKRRAEPGPKSILGETYASDTPSIEDAKEFLRNISIHPDTARHIATKLVVHFIDDKPDQSQIDEIASAFLKTNGDLMAAYKAMLDHEESWKPIGGKVKRPFDFVVSGMRALNVTPSDLENLTRDEYAKYIGVPMQLMGQIPFRALGPDGHPEAANFWITPSGLAARLQWAIQTSEEYTNKVDPRDFPKRVLGPFASEDLVWSAARAENTRESLALVLASPEFNRR